MEQTAVEWLWQMLIEGNYINDIEELKEKAKEMEKEQIIESYCQGCFDIIQDENIFPRETSEQYYNQTFKSE
jgi:predicted adenine nucleotide alpha hydrolase (AANH) superfamily ATPase